MNPTTSRVVAYLPTWYSGSLDSIRYSKLTHINYAFIDPTPAGGLTGLPMSGDARLTSLVTKAHAAGVKVLISIGGWSDGDDSGFVQMAASSSTRTTFVNNVVTFVTNYGLDGVDIDWEYPDAGTAEATNYAALMSQLSTEMHSRSKLLTAAVAATSYYGNGILSEVFGYVDFLVLMAYDGGTPHSTFAYAEQSLDYWLARGLPQSKAVLGVPFYGRDSADGYKAYRTIVRDDAQAPNKDESGGFHYNGLNTIKQKTTLSLQRGSGVGIWELTQDTTLASISLLDAIQEAMNSPVPPYDPTRVVYDDALTSGWADWSWDVSLNFASTSPVYQGTKAIAGTYTAAWGGMYLRHASGINPSGLTKLEFYVHGGTAGGQDLRVHLGDTGAWLTKVKVDDYVEGGGVAANTWRKVSIPLSAVGVTTLPIIKLVVQDGDGVPQPTFHIDYIRFVP
ncbi:MAG TPA: glycosyl hydrolase family 18 protein [Longimicrobiaceae bacterium]|nr:glycosyl hydrolase family 18 protein [Longimicrobiaceae bacterium]